MYARFILLATDAGGGDVGPCFVPQCPPVPVRPDIVAGDAARGAANGGRKLPRPEPIRTVATAGRTLIAGKRHHRRKAGQTVTPSTCSQAGSLPFGTACGSFGTAPATVNQLRYMLVNKSPPCGGFFVATCGQAAIIRAND